MSHSGHSTAFIRLLEIMAHLRSSEGCPWDAQQTPETLKPHILEETYEVLEAIDLRDSVAICQELGDLLLQVVFLAQIFDEKDVFNISDVADSISEKLIRRHPHVFKGKKINSFMELNQQWDEIKTRERSDQGKPVGILDNIPATLPALFKAQKMTQKASRVGFDWNCTEGVVEKVQEEFEEFERALQTKSLTNVEHELGDILLSMVNLARFVDLNAEEALRKATVRFQKRFEFMETQLQLLGKEIKQATPEEMDSLWEKAKKLESVKRCIKGTKEV